MTALPLDPNAGKGHGMRRSAVAGYAMGEFGANLGWNMMSGFILYYFSNVAGLPLAQVATLLLLTRIVDALIDPIIGLAVDRTQSRYGRARPWLLLAGIPFSVLSVLCFSVPQLSAATKMVYAYATFGLVGIFYSALYVPYSSLLPLMTSNSAEKIRLSALRGVAASAGSILVYSTMIPLVTFFGHGNEQHGFTIASGIMTALTAVCMAIVFFSTKERSQFSASVREIDVKTSQLLLRNPVWIVGALLAIVMFFRIGSMVSITIYFAKEVLGSAGATSFLLSSLSVSLLIGGLLSARVIAWLGLRKANVLAICLSVACSLAGWLMRDNWIVFASLYFVNNTTLAVQQVTCFTLAADAVDCQERRFGSRNEGLLTSANSFAQKAGMAVGGSISGFGLALIGYAPDGVPGAHKAGIAAIYFGLPAFFAIVQLIIVAFYNPRWMSDEA